MPLSPMLRSMEKQLVLNKIIPQKRQAA